MLQFVGENAARFRTEYGKCRRRRSARFSARCWRSISRAVRVSSESDARHRRSAADRSSGTRVVNVLAAASWCAHRSLFDLPALAAVGALRTVARSRRQGKPALVFFFDEAHLLFPTPCRPRRENRAGRPPHRRRASGLFRHQSPSDVPEVCWVSSATGAARVAAFTPRDQKAVKVAADTLGRTALDVGGRSASSRSRSADLAARREGSRP